MTSPFLGAQTSIVPEGVDYSSLTGRLPPPPPGIRKKAPSIWDEDHISETLANIGAGFFNSTNFGEGLGNAASAMAKGQSALRAEQKKSVSYGGPDDTFEITSDAFGNRTVREVPAFRQAVDRSAAAKAADRNGMSDKDKADIRSRTLHALMKLPPEQRASAYAKVMADPQAYSLDTAGMPTAWDDTYGQIGSMGGLTVNQALGREQAAENAENLNAYRKSLRADRQQRTGIMQAREARQALRGPPASVRKGGAKAAKGYSIVQSRADFDRLPSGSKFKAPDGSLRIKP